MFGVMVMAQAGSMCALLQQTRKYDPRCHSARPPVLVPLLITGTGGSGTSEVAAALNHEGIRALHERINKQALAVVSWKHAVSDSALGYPYPYTNGALLQPLSPAFQRVVHLVRCPLSNIASLLTHKEPSVNFTARALGIPPVPPIRRNGETHYVFRKTEPQLEPSSQAFADKLAWAALTWIGWNRHVASYADGLVQIEQLTAQRVGNRSLWDQLNSTTRAGVDLHAVGLPQGMDLWEPRFGSPVFELSGGSPVVVAQNTDGQGDALSHARSTAWWHSMTSGRRLDEPHLASNHSNHANARPHPAVTLDVIEAAFEHSIYRRALDVSGEQIVETLIADAHAYGYDATSGCCCQNTTATPAGKR